MIGRPGLALIDGPPVSLTTFRMPPDAVGGKQDREQIRELDAAG